MTLPILAALAALIVALLLADRALHADRKSPPGARAFETDDSPGPA